MLRSFPSKRKVAESRSDRRDTIDVGAASTVIPLSFTRNFYVLFGFILRVQGRRFWARKGDNARKTKLVQFGFGGPRSWHSHLFQNSRTFHFKCANWVILLQIVNFSSQSLGGVSRKLGNCKERLVDAAITGRRACIVL